MRTLSISLFCVLVLTTGCEKKSNSSRNNGVIFLDGAYVHGDTALIVSDCPELNQVLVHKNPEGFFRIQLSDFSGPCSLNLAAVQPTRWSKYGD